MYVEPVKLIGEGKYNLNDIKEIEVTDSYLSLKNGVKGCQTEEEMNDCTTRQFMNNFLKKCGCLPFSINKYGNISIILND